MAINEPPNPPKQLQNLHHVVHLVYHRNKNQHRRSHWWRHLNSFRRDLRTLSSVASTAEPRRTGAANDSDPAALSLPPSMQRLLRRWATDRVPRWHAAFSRILAERRFVAVGLVLLAALAQAAELLGVRQLMAEELLERLPVEEPLADVQGAVGSVHLAGDEVDLGVVVDRETVEVMNTTEEKSRDRKMETRKRTTKRRKGNVIDDLFGELG
jgi:ribonuclease MRP protein subunit RMP1